MGRYIHGPVTGKVEHLIKHAGAEIIPRPVGITPPEPLSAFGKLPKGKVLIAVKHNAGFDAALIADNPIDFQRCTAPGQDAEITYLMIDEDAIDPKRGDKDAAHLKA